MSLIENEKDNRKYTFSELGKMFEQFESIKK